MEERDGGRWAAALARLMKSSWGLCVAMSLLAAPVQSLAAAPYAGRFGVECPEDAFVDLVKQDYRWDIADGQGGWHRQFVGGPVAG